MGLTDKSFQLSNEQIEAINQHFAHRRATYLLANEDIGMLSVKVEFEWVPGFGRFVTAHYDGEIHGYEIEEAGDSTVTGIQTAT